MGDRQKNLLTHMVIIIICDRINYVKISKKKALWVDINYKLAIVVERGFLKIRNSCGILV